MKTDGHSDVQIAGNISAGNDVTIFSCCDITVAGLIEASDRIHLLAKDDLPLLPQSSLTGINGGQGCFVYLSARDHIILDGYIDARKLIVH